MNNKKEEKICSFTQKGQRLQLIRVFIEWDQIKHDKNFNPYIDGIWIEEKFQIRLNRKIIQTSIDEYEMRKVFATYCQNIVLQLKIY